MKINGQYYVKNVRPISRLVFKYQELNRKFFKIILDIQQF